jgi:hypothetical protein
MKYNFNNIRYRWTGTIFEPTNKDTVYFRDALPTNLLINIEETKTGTLAFFPEDDIVYLDAFPYMRKKYFSAIKEKTNIPHDLIDDFESFNYDRDEELAFLLRFYLEEIRQTEKTGSGPNVMNTITRSELSYFAFDLLNGLISKQNPHLHQLLRSLLDLDKSEKDAVEKADKKLKKQQAFKMKVEIPNIKNTEIAHILDVHPSTISNWFNSSNAEEIKQQVKYSKMRIYDFWARNEDFTTEQIARSLDIEAEYINNLKNDEKHNIRLNFYKSAINYRRKTQPLE